MSDWPAGLRVGPLRDWPGVRTPESARRRSPFYRNTRYENGKRIPGGEVPLTETLELLDRELRAIDARDIELLLDIEPGRFRLDGRPRADAIARTPGALLTFENARGRHSYPCDAFTTWEANLRGIAKGLEALRLLSRYGISEHGEAYRAYLAIESATAVPATPFSHEPASIIRWLARFSEDDGGARMIQEFGMSDAARRILRKAQRFTHPDRDGDREQFRLVTIAEQYLREAGTL